MEADRRPTLGDVCIAHLAAGGTVATASRRLARLLRQRYNAAQAAAGRRVWSTPQVLPLDSWLGAVWAAGSAALPGAPRLLSDLQAEQPWRSAVEALPPPGTLVGSAEFASLSRASWHLLRQHGGSLATLAREPLTLDQSALLGWARRVEQELQARGWLDPALLAEAVATLPAQALAGEPLLLAGFARLRPDQAALVAALRRAGRHVKIAPVAGSRGAAFRLEAGDPAAETQAMLAWARARLSREPGARLALVVPDLGMRRASIERAAAAALEPALELPGTAAAARCFDLAGGPPLLACRVVADALDALTAVRQTVPFEVISRLLRSPHVAAGVSEGEARVRFDGWLREQAGLAEWPAASLVTAAREHGLSRFAAAHEAAHGLWREARGPRPAGAWSRVLGGVLGAWGWPGDEPLASDEYQAARTLREAIDVLASLDGIAAPMGPEAAVAEFRRLCAAPFQPERGEPAVVVFDRLEAPGLDFDGLWVSGLTAAEWPRAPTPDALLPAGLQRRLGIPGATAEDCRADAAGTLDAWLGTAPEVVLSWPVQQDDARVEGSPLVPPLAPLPAPAVLPDAVAVAWAGRDALEPLPADEPPPLAANRARGGARLLELQGQCPFRAFAEFRLGARAFEEPSPGVDRRTRGDVLHCALDLFWGATGSSAQLAALGPVDRDERIARSVDSAIADLLPAGTGPRAAALERAWQVTTLGAMVALDARRPAFTVVEREQALAATLSGLGLSLRVDRIDRVDGRLVVIDYKTGRASTGGWSGARMDAPQLPLYAVLHPGDVGAIAFGLATPHEARYSGVGADAALVPGLKAAGTFDAEEGVRGLTWGELKARWHAWLGRLAEDHLAGVARVDPKLPATCRYCHLDTLCRVRGRLEEAETPVEPDAGDTAHD